MIYVHGNHWPREGALRDRDGAVVKGPAQLDAHELVAEPLEALLRDGRA